MMEKILIIAVINLIFYFRALRFGYVADDLAGVQKEEHTLKRWVDYLFFMKGHYNPSLEHLTQTLLHTAVCCMIFTAFGANTTSFLAALLFTFNPANNQCSIHLSGRYYTVGALLIMLMWQFKPFAWILYIVVSVWSFGFNYFLAPVLFLFSSSHQWTACLFVFTAFYWFRWKYRDFFRRKREMHTTERMRQIDGRKLIFVIRSFAYYFAYCIFPRRIGMYHTFGYSYGLADEDTKKNEKVDAWFFGGCAAIFLMVSAYFYNREIFFGLFWFSVLIAQWCHLVGMNQPFAERYVYVANIGLMVALAHVSSIIPHGSYFATGFLVYYVTRLWLHMGAYKNNKLFFEYNLYDINHSDSFMAWLIKGEREAVEDRAPFQALDSFKNGLYCNKRYPRFHFQVATVLTQVNQFDAALWHFRECIKYPIQMSGVSANDFEILEKKIKIGLNGKVELRSDGTLN